MHGTAGAGRRCSGCPWHWPGRHPSPACLLVWQSAIEVLRSQSNANYPAIYRCRAACAAALGGCCRPQQAGGGALPTEPGPLHSLPRGAAALDLPRRNRLDALAHDAYKKSQAQCACMAPSRRGSHPSYDCALDGPGMFGGLEDSYVNRPADCERLPGRGEVGVGQTTSGPVPHWVAPGRCQSGGPSVRRGERRQEPFGRAPREALRIAARGPAGDDKKNGPWKPNYRKGAEALATNHTTLTKPTRGNLGWDPTWANTTSLITTTGFCCSPK